MTTAPVIHNNDFRTWTDCREAIMYDLAHPRTDPEYMSAEDRELWQRATEAQARAEQEYDEWRARETLAWAEQHPQDAGEMRTA